MPITLVPVSGLWLLLNPQAERYLYVPSAGLALAGAAALSGLSRSRLPGARPAALALAAGVLVLYSLGTVTRNLDYRDDAALHAATAAVDPGVARARFNLARSLHGQGRLDAAEAEYREALRLWPGFAGWRGAFALLLLDRGRPAEAAAELEAALRQQPGEPAVHYFLGVAHWRAGRPAAAEAQFDAALRLDPQDQAAAQAKLRVRESRGRTARQAPASYLNSPMACSAAAYEQSRLMLSMPCSPASGK
jgi:tetratricopeptide (TPR) repeat protein